MASSIKLSQHDSLEFEDTTLFPSIVGGLQYLSLTRLDIAFAVNKACQFMHCPKIPHWTVVKRILWYLKATLNYVLFFKSQTCVSLQAYTDADWAGCTDEDWAGCPNDKRFTSGFVVFLGSYFISWSSKKQMTVARSSTEVEYKALSSSVAKLIWLQSMLKELGISLSTTLAYTLVQQHRSYISYR
ncbi:uncharacterized mitochondrial protein AtMg00810-like [Carya illinoinensis]|uniref:uncharacterized mitochondrial protein AtMg00810-like n=1 Tax=Carya illinoinensis TaxID=32201 RepID=UPI001C71C61A|nr:uncharacterized mitochondrial protein AtMg00810-like [Carya illinoinensis]